MENRLTERQKRQERHLKTVKIVEWLFKYKKENGAEPSQEEVNNFDSNLTQAENAKWVDIYGKVEQGKNIIGE